MPRFTPKWRRINHELNPRRPSHEAKNVGARLALFAGQLGSHFGVGEPKSVTVHGTEQHMFLFDSKRHYLCVSAKAGGNVNALDGEIRRVLAQK